MTKVTKKMALDYHHLDDKPGKISVTPSKPHQSQADLSLAYSPGVAYPCLEIKDNPADVFKYTNKGNLVGVVSNGTAVLGLGNIGALAGKPVMEGKALLFKIFAGLDSFDIEVDEKDPEKFIAAVKAISPTFGGINLEDIKAPECFEIERRLKAECDIPVMHDDQHGTAIISAAGLLNALEIQGKKAQDVKLVVNGAGAAATCCTRLYMELGVKRENIVMCDSHGVISTHRADLSEEKKEFATTRDITTLEQAMVGADVFLGLSVADVVTPEMVQSMAAKPIVFGLANPNPEISHDKAIESRPDLIYATGRSDYPNQINNVLGFPYIFRGAIDCSATEINGAMELAAVKAIANLAKQPVPPIVNAAYNLNNIKFGPQYILPKALDPRLITEVSAAVAKAAALSGVAKRPIDNYEAYKRELRQLMGYDNKLVRRFHEEAMHSPKRVVYAQGGSDNMLQAAVQAHENGLCYPILLGDVEMIEKRAKQLKLNLNGIEVMNPRRDNQKERRTLYATAFAQRNQREGVTMAMAIEHMYDRNYFGMEMVMHGEADALITGMYGGGGEPVRIAKEVVGIKPGYSHFATVHILNTKHRLLFIADTLINHEKDTQTLVDIARLTHSAVKNYAHSPVMAMLSYSNFGTNTEKGPSQVHEAVNILHRENPDMVIDGEMQVQYALDKDLRDKQFPFNLLNGKDVNTLIFPSLSSANSTYQMLLNIGAAEMIGPIQVGLNRPIHFAPIDAPVRDIVNLTAMAVIDANIYEKTKR